MLIMVFEKEEIFTLKRVIIEGMYQFGTDSYEETSLNLKYFAEILVESTSLVHEDTSLSMASIQLENCAEILVESTST